ncbi:MAG: PIN domain-containing protein [Acidimicrobiia bacterium]
MIGGSALAARPVVVDVNVLVSAVVAGTDSFQSWPSPPPVRGNRDAQVIGVLNDAREFALFTSEHILSNVVRVLTGAPPDGYGWEVSRAAEYVQVLGEIAMASGGGVVVPGTVVTDSRDHEDNRILECAAAAGAIMIVSNDQDLLELSPWRGTPVITSEEFIGRVDAMRRSSRRRR